jgi:hypothetical protein
MLFLPVVNHRRFQTRPEGPFHFQTYWRFFHLRLPTTCTDRFVLPHFNDLCLRFRQFSDLVHFDQPSFICQFAMTVLAALRPYWDDMIRLGCKLAFMFLVPFRRAVPVTMPTLRMVLFLIPRWRLRGVLR